MEVIFADAFYFIALLNDVDQHHQEAIVFSAAKRAILVTTDYILVEVADALAKTEKRKEFKAFMKFVRSASWIDIVGADRQLFDCGMELYANRPDKQWSLTDCMSFVVMEARGITDALTHDHHFKLAGFRVLL